MIHHIVIKVSDLKIAKAFYQKVLTPMGYTLFFEMDETYVGFGIKGKPDFWLHQDQTQTSKLHFAFKAQNQKEVDAFYEAAIKAGGSDNGKPGLRPRYQYYPNYYGAFVLDPDGNNIEAVCHD